MSAKLIQCLLVIYAIICATALLEGKWFLALYWIGALVINSAVLMMSGK